MNEIARGIERHDRLHRDRQIMDLAVRSASDILRRYIENEADVARLEGEIRKQASLKMESCYPEHAALAQGGERE